MNHIYLISSYDCTWLSKLWWCDGPCGWSRTSLLDQKMGNVIIKYFIYCIANSDNLRTLALIFKVMLSQSLWGLRSVVQHQTKHQTPLTALSDFVFDHQLSAGRPRSVTVWSGLIRTLITGQSGLIIKQYQIIHTDCQPSQTWDTRSLEHVKLDVYLYE